MAVRTEHSRIVSVILNVEEYDALRKAAKEDRRKMSAFLRVLLGDFLVNKGYLKPEDRTEEDW